jgi:hypothetical protein
MLPIVGFATEFQALMALKALLHNITWLSLQVVRIMGIIWMVMGTSLGSPSTTAR